MAQRDSDGPTVPVAALMVLDAVTGEPKGILTEADIARAVADGKNLNEVRIRELMTSTPAVIHPRTRVRDAAQIMTSGHFPHLPVAGDSGLVGITDITGAAAATEQLPGNGPRRTRRCGPGHSLETAKALNRANSASIWSADNFLATPLSRSFLARGFAGRSWNDSNPCVVPHRHPPRDTRYFRHL